MVRKLISWFAISMAAVAFAVITGCSVNPLGMSDAEWELLTSTQKFEARLVQESRQEEARARRAEQVAQESAEQARIVDLRYNAPLGDVIQCTITDAEGYFAVSVHSRAFLTHT